jgi:hypothetical protein
VLVLVEYIDSYLLIEDYFLLLENIEILFEAFEFSLLLQSALHGALAILNQPTWSKHG